MMMMARFVAAGRASMLSDSRLPATRYCVGAESGPLTKGRP